MTEEMRNPKAISTAFETASTGHRGVGYPHTITAISTKNSIIETLPGDQQPQLRRRKWWR